MLLSELLQLRQNKNRLDYLCEHRDAIVPFIGAGVSKACGLYTWREILEILSSEFLPKTQRKNFSKSSDNIGFAEAIINASGNSNIIMNRIAEIINETNVNLTKAPYIIITSFSNNIITTNYDRILEEAANNLGTHYQLNPLLPCLKGQVTTAIQENRRCLIKLHGSIEETSSMIFSKSQYDMFYGNPNNYDTNYFPLQLQNIFNGKSILFIGCSLTNDRTMDILTHCIEKNKQIKHFAIVELPDNENKEIEQRNQLSSLGIIPIYFPKEDYDSIDLLLEYLARDNSFIKDSKKIICNYINKESDTYHFLCSLLNESYYNTAQKYPQLLDINSDNLNLVNEYNAKIDHSKEISESLYETCIHLFDLLSKTGIHSSLDIRDSLINNFSDAVLRETDIYEILQKHHPIYKPKNLDISGKSDYELTKLADELNRKLQFESEKGFRNFVDIYNQALELLDNAYDKIEMKQRVILCNTIGAWGTFLRNSEKPIYYLNLAIKTILSLDERERPYSLLSQCYCNKALLYAYIDMNYNEAINYAKKDIEIKKSININPRLLAGSMGHYGLYQKEIDPFSALQTHIDTINLKRKNIENACNLRFERDKKVSEKEMNKKLIASWATSVFNLGLLAKDLLLYEEAGELIEIANKYRYSIIDKTSKDYNSSYTVEAELDILLHKEHDVIKYINAIEKRIHMNPQLSTTLYHTWYVCALYYYSQEIYDVALQYIRKFYNEYYFKGDIKDYRQTIRAQLLEVQILINCKSNINRAKMLLDKIIEKIKSIYSDDSFWLIEPYKLYGKIDNHYVNNLISLQNKYTNKTYAATETIKKCIFDISNTKPQLN